MIRYENPVWNTETHSYDYVVTTVGVGSTLYVISETERIMSDVWESVTRAYYFTPEGIQNICIDYYSDSRRMKPQVTLDADYELAISEFHARALDRARQERRAAHERGAQHTAVKGREVVVTRGRSHVGVRGQVVVIKEMMYRAGYRSTLQNKLAIALDDEMTTWTAPSGRQYPVHKNVAWVWSHNCQVADFTVNEAEIEQEAQAEANRKTQQFRQTCIKHGALEV